MVKRFVLVASLVLGLSLTAPAADAQASNVLPTSWSWSSQSVVSWSFSSFLSWLKAKIAELEESWKADQSNGAAVPELDPGAAGSALVLLIGGVAYLTARRRKEDEEQEQA